MSTQPQDAPKISNDTFEAAKIASYPASVADTKLAIAGYDVEAACAAFAPIAPGFSLWA